MKMTKKEFIKSHSNTKQANNKQKKKKSKRQSNNSSYGSTY